MKGFRTLAINFALAVGPAALGWAAGVDWTQYVSPTTAIAIVGAVNIGLRCLTSTPVGRKS